MRNRENRAILAQYAPNPAKKQEARELLMRTIHSVHTDNKINIVGRKDNDKSA